MSVYCPADGKIDLHELIHDRDEIRRAWEGLEKDPSPAAPGDNKEEAPATETSADMTEDDDCEDDSDSDDNIDAESDSSDESAEPTGLQTALGVLVKYLDDKAGE